MKNHIYVQKQFVVVLLPIFIYASKLKKAFCFDICPMPISLENASLVWFEGFPSYLSRKNLKKHFSASVLQQPQKILSRFSLLRQHFWKPSNQMRETFSSELTWTNIETKYHYSALNDWEKNVIFKWLKMSGKKWGKTQVLKWLHQNNAPLLRFKKFTIGKTIKHT